MANYLTEHPGGRFQSIRRSENPPGRNVEMELVEEKLLNLTVGEGAFLVGMLPDFVPGLCHPPHLMKSINP